MAEGYLHKMPWILAKYGRWIVVPALVALTFSGSAQFDITIDINSEDSTTLYADEPAVIYMALGNSAALTNTLWNAQAEDYLDTLKKQRDMGQMTDEAYLEAQESIRQGLRPVSAPVLGSPSDPWISDVHFEVKDTSGIRVPVDIHLMDTIGMDAQISLDAQSYVAVNYGIAPEIVSGLSPGAYSLRCRIDSVYSNTVFFEILSRPMPLTVRNTEEMLLHVGNYYLLNDNIDEALRYAQIILENYPGSIAGTIFRADAQLQAARFAEALRDYRTALDLYYRTYPDATELPVYLLDMIDWLEERN